MPGIHRRPRIGFVDITEIGEDTKPKPKYCVRCKDMFGMLSPLGPKIIPPEDVAKPKPTDYDNWIQCHQCGTVYAAYEVKAEAGLSTLVEADRNPFDRKEVFESVGESRRIDLTGKNQLKRRRKKAIEDIKDPDVKRELQSPGTELVSYEVSKDF